MARNRTLLIGGLAVVMVGGLLLRQHRAGAHHAPALQLTPIHVQIDPAGAEQIRIPVANGSTPGQLTILGSKGQATGVCPLKHTDVQADIAGYVARVTVTQEFANPATTPVEALYTFPLPEDAAVDDMTMTVGDRTIKGQILRREEARQVYEAAKAAGQATALLDQERPNIFTQSVANIMPGQTIKIAISYVNLLKYQEGQYEFVFPMVVGPRYIPNGGYTQPGERGASSPQPQILGDPGETPAVTDADKITPPITPPETRAGHDISVTVHLDAGLPLRDIRSTLHAIDVRAQGASRAIIRLQEQDRIPNRDFILHYTAAGSELQSGILTYAPAHTGRPSDPAQVSAPGGYFTLIVQPPSAPPRNNITPKEMVFVIDQTGSQSGWPIAKAKETMRHCIENLNSGDTFQLLGFNTELYPCFAKPVPATPATIAKALKFLAPIEGNGGTDILKSVNYALSLPDDPDRLRIVCYMTDGYVGNDMQIIDCVKQHRGRARMFPFGCGNSVNRFLIEGMAREGRGVTEYVTLQSDGQQAAKRFYHRIADPLLLDVQVDWSGLPVEEIYPQHIPDVFSAQPIVIKGRYTAPAEGDITIHGLLRGRPWKQTLHLVLPAVKGDGSAIETLWAREKIEDLQSRDWVGAQTNNPDPHLQEQIVATALEHRLMSQYTSFVAVEEKVVNVGGRQRTVDVPVEMPQGVSYDDIFGKKEAQQNQPVQLSMGRASFRSAGVAGSLSTRKQSKRRFGGGGFADVDGMPGGMSGMPSTSAAISPVQSPSLPGMAGINNARGNLSKAESIPVHLDDDIAAGNALGRKRLNAMKPAERKSALRRAKLASSLRTLPEVFAKEGRNGSLNRPGVPKVEKGRIAVQVTLNSLPVDGLHKLKALGFDLAATFAQNRLLIGTVPVDRLDALIELDFVRRIETPQMR